MTARRAISAKMKVDAILHFYIVTCRLCHNLIAPGQPIDWDHYIPLGLGGEHHYENLRPVHRACHRVKTSGRKATTAGSDIGNISKVKRLIRKREGTWRKSTKAWPSKKIPSRPFPQRRAP